MQIDCFVNEKVYSKGMSAKNSLTPNLGGKREGAGRKKVLHKPKSITFECESELVDLIDEDASKNNVSRGQMIRTILEEVYPKKDN